MSIFKWIAFTLLFLVFLAFTFWLLFYIQYRKIQPSYPENLSLKGILKPASIKVDSSGTAHIFAENEQDLITLMGYYVASEHLWEMELIRRAGQGRLSEIFGNATFEFDLMFRNLQLDSLSFYLYENLSKDSKEWLEWYANGVNLFVLERKDNLPIKIQLMEFQPEAWKARDALLVYRTISWLMTRSWKRDIFFQLASNQLPPSLLKYILAGNEPHPKLSQDFNDGIEQIKKLWEIDSRFRKWWGIQSGQYSETGWVINGTRTNSGKGLLINEEPFGKNLPFNWVEVHLSSPQLKTAGFAIPGIPGIFVGRNEDIAWGMTRFPLAETKFYSGNVDIQNKNILIENENHPLEYHKENISVKNREKTFTFLVYNSFRLPILKPMLEDIQTNTVFLLDWTGWYQSDEILCLQQIAKAKNREEFYNAVSHFKVPAELFCFSDRNNNIGLQPGAAVPGDLLISSKSPSRRKERSPIVSWSGFSSYEELPNSYNPDKGWISTASWAEDVSTIIKLCLPAALKFPDQKYIHVDREQINFRVVDSLLSVQRNLQNIRIVSSCLESLNLRDIPAQRLVNLEDVIWLLSNWNGEIELTSVPALIFPLWKWFIFNDLFVDQMGEELFNYFIRLPELYEVVFQQVIMDKTNPWFDNSKTSYIVERRADIIQNSFNNCIEFLGSELGNEIHRWQWKNFNLSEYAQPALLKSFEDFIIEEAPLRKIGYQDNQNLAIGFTPAEYSTVMEMEDNRIIFIMDWQNENGYQRIKDAGFAPTERTRSCYRTFNRILDKEQEIDIDDNSSNFLLNIRITPE
jgi:penicillin amidase